MHHVWDHLAHISFILEPIAVAAHSGLCSLDGQIFNSSCFQRSLLQMKSTFLLKIQNLLRELCVSGLTVCQISTSVFEPLLNVSPTTPSCFSHYSLPGESCNIPLPLLRGQDNAASSDTASSQPCAVSHGPLASLQAHSHLDLCVTLHHSRATRAGSCLILFPSWGMEKIRSKGSTDFSTSWKQWGCDDLATFDNLEHETHPLALSIVSLCSCESYSISNQAAKNGEINTGSVIH